MGEVQSKQKSEALGEDAAMEFEGTYTYIIIV